MAAVMLVPKTASTASTTMMPGTDKQQVDHGVIARSTQPPR